MALFPDLSEDKASSTEGAQAPLLPCRCDHTTLVGFLRCPRYGYFRSILGWHPDVGENHHLIFGRAWHKGLEDGYNAIRLDQAGACRRLSIKELSDISQNAFNENWNANPSIPSDDILGAKTWDNGMMMLQEYWNIYAGLDQNEEILSVETIGSFGLPNEYNTQYVMKIDTVIRSPETNLTSVLEHKTTGWLTSTLLEGFNLSYQGEGYLVYLQSISPEDATCRAIYNLCHITKTKKGFPRHMISRKQNLMSRFIQEITNHINTIINQTNLANEWIEKHTALGDIRQDSLFFPYFPRVPGPACTAFMRSCDYANLCFSTSNPLKWGRVPPGFIIRYWDPEAEEGA